MQQSNDKKMYGCVFLGNYINSEVERMNRNGMGKKRSGLVLNPWFVTLKPKNRSLKTKNSYDPKKKTPKNSQTLKKKF